MDTFERHLRASWCKTLNHADAAGIDSTHDFFHLGGDSLSAGELIQCIRSYSSSLRGFGSLRDVYEHPTFAGMLAFWKNGLINHNNASTTQKNTESKKAVQDAHAVKAKEEMKERKQDMSACDRMMQEVFGTPFVAEAEHMRLLSSSSQEVAPEVDFLQAFASLQIRQSDQSLAISVSSYSQDRIYYAERMRADHSGGKCNPVTSYHITRLFQLSGVLNMNALQRACTALITRHAQLRTEFYTDVTTGMTMQRVRDAGTVRAVIQYGGIVNTPAQWASEADATPFQFDTAPLFRCHVASECVDKTYVFLVFHHLIMDGWSLGTFFEELGVLYQYIDAHKQVEENVLFSLLPTLPTWSYLDFSHWNRTVCHPETMHVKVARQLDFWKQKLTSYEHLELLLDFPRATQQPSTSLDGDVVRWELGPLQYTRLLKFCAEHRYSLFSVLMATLQLVLSKCTMQSDIMIGSVAAGRHYPDARHVLGCFINPFVCRTIIKDAQRTTGHDLFKQVHNYTLDALENQDVPFDQVARAVQQQSTRHPLFQVMFVLQNQGTRKRGRLDLGSACRVERVQYHGRSCKMDLSLVAEESSAAASKTLQLLWEFNTSVLMCQTVAHLADVYGHVLNQILDEPGLPLSLYTLLSEPEKHRVLYEFNNTNVCVDHMRTDLTMHELFTARAHKCPSLIAVRDSNHLKVTYAELDRLSSAISQHLHRIAASPIRPDDLVAISMEPSIDLFAWILGILKSGAAYVPIDPAYPMDRKEYILRDSGAKLLVTQSSGTAAFAHMLAGLQIQIVNAASIDVQQAIDNYREDLKQHSEPAGLVKQHHLAYVIYTSGTTGAPKGVMVQHDTLCNTARYLLPDLSPGLHVLQFASQSFDAAVAEWSCAFAAGCCLCLTHSAAEKIGQGLVDTIQHYKINVAILSPSVMANMIPQPFPTIQYIMVAGEANTDTILRAWKPYVQLVNGAGPTETTVCCSRFRYDDFHPAACIGPPQVNYRCYVLDEAQQPVPIGVNGELYIGGVGVARGYLNRPDLTMNRFVSDPFVAKDNALAPELMRFTRMYKSGDVVRWLADGTLLYVNRNDRQVKIRGIRIELGEIEHALCQHPEIGRAVVLARDMGGSLGKTLVAFIVAKPMHQHTLTTSDVQQFLGYRLPSHLLPAHYIKLDSFPLNSSNKTDVKALESMDIHTHATLMVKTDGISLKKVHKMQTPRANPRTSLRLSPPLSASSPRSLSNVPCPGTNTPRRIPGTPRTISGTPRPSPSAPRWRGMLMTAWSTVLNRSDLIGNENFFEVGGHSLLIAQLHNILPDELRSQVSIMDLFQYPSIDSMVDHLGWDNNNTTKTLQNDDLSLAESGESMFEKESSSLHEPIAIIGMAGRFPGADTVNDLWHNLCIGQESIVFYTADELEAYGVDPELLAQASYVRAAGPVNDIYGFDASFFGFTPREAESMDPQQRIFLETVWSALEDAGYPPNRSSTSSTSSSVEEPHQRIGVFAGSGQNHYLSESGMSDVARLPSAERHFLTTLNEKDFLASRVNYKLNLQGPAIVVQTACSTSLVAVHMACESLHRSECDVALAGGVSLGPLRPTGFLYESGMILSPDGHTRSFDAEACGTVRSQGAGAIVLKKLSKAVADGDLIYAVLKGSAINNDGNDKVSYSSPSTAGQAKVIESALQNADVHPRTISYVEAHGTATALGDPIEVAALTQTYRAYTDDVGFAAMGSIKSNIGHLDAAAGIAGLIKAALVLHHRQIPPTLHFKQANPLLKLPTSPFFINNKLQSLEDNGSTPLRASVSSFGIGGTNAHAILEAVAPIPSSNHPLSYGTELDYIPLCWSAHDANALQQQLRNIIGFLRSNPHVPLQEVAYTLMMHRAHLSYRQSVIVAASHPAGLEGRTHAHAISLLEGLGDTNATKSSHGSASVTFMFPGQGSQFAGMGMELYRAEADFRAVVDGCVVTLRSVLPSKFSAVTIEDLWSNEALMNKTEYTQPAIFILEYSLATLLQSWGLRPSGLIGHSLGEYVAACIAGVFSVADGLKLILARSQLMQQCVSSGAMLSIRMNEAEWVRRYSAYAPSVTVAASNSPAHIAVSGAHAAIEALSAVMARDEIQHTLLHTSHAFHSPMLEPMVEAFRKCLKRVTMYPNQIPIACNLTGAWVDADQIQSEDYWIQHLLHKVCFSAGVQTLLEKKPNHSVFVEVGPGEVCATLLRRHLEVDEKRVECISLLPRKFSSTGSVEHVMGSMTQLWRSHVPVAWFKLFGSTPHPRVRLPTYPFQHQIYQMCRQESVVVPKVPAAVLSPISVAFNQRVAARTKIPSSMLPNVLEEVVIQVFSEALGTKPAAIETHHDFFALGGDSLLAIQVLSKLKQRFQVPLSGSALMSNPTVAMISTVIRDLLKKHDSSMSKTATTVALCTASGSLICIQPGNVGITPIYLIHPIGGELYYYRDLAPILGAHQPVFGFRATSLDGLNPVNNIPAMAMRYVHELLSSRGLSYEEIRASPHLSGKVGPLVLGGVSFGGTVAYEMALILSSLEVQILFLILIDAPAPGALPARLGDVANVLEYIAGGNLGATASQLRDLATQNKCDILSAARLDPATMPSNTFQAASSGSSIPAISLRPPPARMRRRLPSYITDSLLATWMAHEKAMFSYEVPNAQRRDTFRGKVMFIRPSEALPHTRLDMHIPWMDMAPHDLRICQVPGNHLTMNSKQLIHNWGVLLREALQMLK